MNIKNNIKIKYEKFQFYKTNLLNELLFIWWKEKNLE